MTGDWKYMGNDHDSSMISMHKVGELLKYYARDPEGFKASFSLARIRGQYGATNPERDEFGVSTELLPGGDDWQCKIHGFPADAEFGALCNPEDLHIVKLSNLGFLFPRFIFQFQIITAFVFRLWFSEIYPGICSG